MIVFGIDPGVSGAISVFDNKKIINFFDMPTMIDGKKNKRQVNAAQLAHEIKSRVVDREKTLYRTQNQNVFIEYIQDLTGDNGQTKKRNSELKFNYSALVARSRIELPTPGL